MSDKKTSITNVYVDEVLYTLRDKINVFSKDKNDFVPSDAIIIKIKGKKGISRLNSLKDAVSEGIWVTTTRVNKMFNEEMLKDTAKNEIKEEESKKDIEKEMNIAIDQLKRSTCWEKIYDKCFPILTHHGKINNVSLSEELQEDMSIYDLNRLVEVVLRHFLLPDMLAQNKNIA